MTPTITFTILLKTVNELNAHEHWRNRQKRAKVQRLTAKMHAHAAAGTKRIKLPCVVRLTRFSRGKLDHGDGLSASMKHVRDGIADWLEVDDGCDLIAFDYAQERGEAAVKVEVFEACRLTVRIERVVA